MLLLGLKVEGCVRAVVRHGYLEMQCRMMFGGQDTWTSYTEDR